MHLIFILPSSHSDNKVKKIPKPHLHENPQHGADDKPKTASEIGHFIKEDMNTFNCALLFKGTVQPDWICLEWYHWKAL
jgi:hypothetical protein